MQDLIVIAIIVFFFALCLAFVAGCSRILGPAVAETRDEEDLDPDAEPGDVLRAAA